MGLLTDLLGGDGAAFVGVRVFKSAAQSVADSVETVVTFDSESFDSHGFHDNVTNNSRITVPAGQGGKYQLNAQLAWAVNGGGGRYLGIRLNGSAVLYGPSSTGIASLYAGNVVGDVVNLVAGDYIEAVGYQSSGGNLNVVDGTANSFISIVKVGA